MRTPPANRPAHGRVLLLPDDARRDLHLRDCPCGPFFAGGGYRREAGGAEPRQHVSVGLAYLQLAVC